MAILKTSNITAPKDSSSHHRFLPLLFTDSMHCNDKQSSLDRKKPAELVGARLTFPNSPTATQLQSGQTQRPKALQQQLQHSVCYPYRRWSPSCVVFTICHLKPEQFMTSKTDPKLSISNSCGDPCGPENVSFILMYNQSPTPHPQ